MPYCAGIECSENLLVVSTSAIEHCAICLSRSRRGVETETAWIAYTVARMTEFITYKRWALRDGREESELVELVSQQIVPHFKKLQGCLRLGLRRIEGTRSYLALQYWESHERWRETTRSEYYRAWYEEYLPILDRWDAIMVFEEEWDAEELLGKSNNP